MSITPNHIAEFLALITSIFYWQKIKKGKLRFLPFFFFFILFVELLGNYLHTMKNANIVLYNISIPLEYLFYIFLYHLHADRVLAIFTKIAVAALLFVSGIFYVLTPLNVFHSYVLVTGQAAVIISSCIYFYEQFQHIEEESLLKNYFFWITAGLLLFNLGDLAFFLIYPVIISNNWDKFDFLFKEINNSLLLLLYLSYIISIFVYKKYTVTNAS